MRRAALLAVVLSTGCGGGPQCFADASGNLSARVEGRDACPALVHGEQGWSLELDLKGRLNLELSIALGEAPAAGRLTSTHSGSWRAVSRREPGCVYSAGSQALPAGAFDLELHEVDLARPLARGSLDVLQAVHALPGADCGPGDDERVEIDF